MAAKYVNITIEEMDAFLAPQGFVKLTLPGVQEIIFGKRVPHNKWQLTLRIFTGIDPCGQSRGVGEDAVRAVLMLRKPDGAIIKLSGDKRVHRVEGWRKNLQSRIDHWLDLMPKDSCAKCGMPMLPRKGKFGDFLGCAGYPVCKNILPIERPKPETPIE